MAQFPKLKLTYFDFTGRAETIRLALHIGGIPFVDERLSREEFAQRKPSFVYGQVPVLEVDGEQLAQSEAILRYIGKLAGLYPANDPLAALKIDEIIGGQNDLMDALTPSLKEKDADKKKAMRVVLAAETIPRFLRLLEARLAKLQDSVVFQTDQIYIHELVLWGMMQMLCSGFVDHIPTDIADPYKLIKAAEAKVSAHPKVQQWNAAKHSGYPKLKLIYFDIPGRAEPIRLALTIGGIPFEDERIDAAELEKRRDSLPFGQIPVLEVDGEVISQSLSILRYTGALTGLYPTIDPVLALRVDEVFGWFEDVGAPIKSVFKMPEGAERDQAFKTLLDVTLPQIMGAMDKRLAQWGGPNAIGAPLTVADLLIYGATVMFKVNAHQGFPPALIESFPNIIRIYTQVREHPKVKDVEWLAKY